MKEDVEIRDHPPAKRRQLEHALDVELAVWAESPQLTPSERRRAAEERARRKAAVPDMRIGLLIGPEGITPEQLARLDEHLEARSPTEILHPGVSTRLHTRCRVLCRSVKPHWDLHEIVKRADLVLAAPRNAERHGGVVWEEIRYAKHRSTPVIVVLPTGEEPNG